MTPRSTPRERENEVLPLRDGVARIRAIRPDDTQLLEALFAGLSEESRRLRFLTFKPRLSGAELAYFTDVDLATHEALIALDGVTGEPLGVIRYVRTSPGAATAELAVAVPDEHARRGVASGLVARLAERARRAGVRCFTGYMLGENLAARRLLEGLGATATRGASPELVEFELPLDEPARVA